LSDFKSANLKQKQTKGFLKSWNKQGDLKDENESLHFQGL
jgi:hypothetical protein